MHRRGVMDPHKRMTRTLACLVASMSLGAAFLDWLRPDDVSTPSRGIELIARGAIPARTWLAIQVMTHTGEQRDLDLRTHFVIDPQGRLISTRSWERQRVLDDVPTVRVALVVPANRRVTAAQRSAAEDLISRLQEALDVSADRVHWF